ncbi:MAG: hypothetical protein HY958_09675 [Bacteroidia bacterium]|nr:hypothetical protein [Bacteroidia bacterium]
MKIKNTTRIIALFMIAIAVVVGSCTKEELDQPQVIIPKFDIPTGSTLVTITQFKARYSDPNYTKLDTIKGDTIIQGKIISNDSTGNIYKYIVIEDATGGLIIKIDNSSLYLQYKLGQRVYVKCKGLVLGAYGKMLQLGVNNAGSISSILDANRKNYIFKDSLPGAVPAMKIVSSIDSLILNDDLCKLVKINNVAFVDSGQIYCSPLGSTNRSLTDADGASLIVRNSNYATWAANIIPSGRGSVVGIFTAYNGAKQLVLRDLNDVIGFLH